MKKKYNKFDALVEKLINEFIKIPNFDLTATDEVANRAFNIVVFRIAEISSYKELVCSHFIPATNKAIFEAKTDFRKSKYRMLLNERPIDFNETLHDTVRLSYVGLFHKLENYINDVVFVTELIFSELYESPGTVEKWAKEKFRFDIRDWRQFFITYKINWICNCVKHKDGLPIKEPKPLGFEYADETKRITITPDEFKKDCEFLIKIYPLYLQTMFLFAQHKMVMERPLLREDYISSDLYDKQVENYNKIEILLEQFLEGLNAMRI